MSSNYCNHSSLSSDILPTLIEVTFRPHSTRCCSFTAVVREGCNGQGVSFSQLTQLIESIGHVGKIDDFAIQPLQQHSFFPPWNRVTPYTVDISPLSKKEAAQMHNSNLPLGADEFMIYTDASSMPGDDSNGVGVGQY
jgi:hypothetical protein